MGSIDEVSTMIVNQARKATGHKGVVQMASKISRYATVSNAEAVAEAFADWYSNGSKAQKESIAIVNVVNQLWRSQKRGKNMTKKIMYSEPNDFFPKELRKKYGLGEYAKENKNKSNDKTSKKSGDKKQGINYEVHI